MLVNSKRSGSTQSFSCVAPGGWAYRFEAYTPPPRRLFGYYAMPLLWSDEVIGWANVRLVAGKLHVAIGYVRRCPQTREFQRALDAELARMERFLTNRKFARRTQEDAGTGAMGPP